MAGTTDPGWNSDPEGPPSWNDAESQGGEGARTRVKTLLARLHGGDPLAQEQLLGLLYGDLHRRAAALMQRQPAGHSLQATALVHEAYLRLVGSRQDPFNDRTHFLRVAATAMRQILVDHARAKRCDKRGQGRARVELDEVVLCYEERCFDLLQLDDALKHLAQFDPEMARAVELRFFGGLGREEVARDLGLRPRSFDRRWQTACAWLRAEMR